MNKVLSGVLFVLLTVLFIPEQELLFAEIYQWTDTNGTVNFSDSPVSAPKGNQTIIRRDVIKNSLNNSYSPATPYSAIKAQKKGTQETSPREYPGSGHERLPDRALVNNFDDASLIAMWNSMTSCLLRGDTDSALNYIHPSTRQQYKQMFAALKPKLPEITATQRNMKLITAGETSAKYELTTAEQGGNYSYDVIFQKDENNKWWIYSY